MRIAVDGMGGDKAPAIVVEGCIQASEEFDYEIILIGNQPQLEEELSKHNKISKNIKIRHASEVIEMGESPVAGIRKKKDSSICVGVDLLKTKEADAFVSAGNTGAVVGASTLFLGLLPGVERPGIAIIYPTPKGVSLLIDVGANIDPKPIHLVQYGIMGEVCLQTILDTNRDLTIGLLNVGEEETKGTEFIKETHRLLGLTRPHFIGNIEGKDIFTGKCEVVVSDGFVGNIVLKVSEGMIGVVVNILKKELSSNLLVQIGSILTKPAFSALKKEFDYAEYGGAPLLGVDGICIIGHGRSSAKAIKNAIRVAGEFVSHQVNQHIVEAIKKI